MKILNTFHIEDVLLLGDSIGIFGSRQSILKHAKDSIIDNDRVPQHKLSSFQLQGHHANIFWIQLII